MQPYYDHGGITIYHGDCREVLPTLNADAVVTDPPYGVGLLAFNDDFALASEGLRLCPGALAAVFMSPRRIVELANQIADSWKFERLLWMHKDADLAAPWHGWNMNGEAILICSRAGYRWPKPQSYRSDLYRAAPWGKVGHPNAKPPIVVRDLVNRLSAPGGTVIDPFMGSGTTLAAAKLLGRRAIGIEIEERYCEMAVRRLAQEVLDFT